MSSIPWLALALATRMVAPEPAPPAFSPGVGYIVAQQHRGASEGPEPAATSEASEASEASGAPPQPPRKTLAPVLPPPPPTDLARVKGSPRAQGILAAAAIATQVAMLVAGVAAVRQQNAALREQRRGRAPAYRPYR